LETEKAAHAKTREIAYERGGRTVKVKFCRGSERSGWWGAGRLGDAVCPTGGKGALVLASGARAFDCNRSAIERSVGFVGGLELVILIVR